MPAPVYLTDSLGEVWLLGVDNAGAYNFTPVTGVTAPTSILLEDTVTAAIWALTLNALPALHGSPGGVDPELTAASGSGVLNLPVTTPNGTLYGICAAGGAVSVITLLVPGSNKIVGVGSKLQYSLDGVTYTEVAFLRKITPQNSKQEIVDKTNILTAGNGDAPLAARYSSGEMQIDGVLSPQNFSQLTLGQLHAQLTLVYWRLTMSNGITIWNWQGFVSEYKPFDIDVMKAVLFGAKIRVWGALTGPIGIA